MMRGETRVVIGVIGPDELVREKPLAAIPGVEVGRPGDETLQAGRTGEWLSAAARVASAT